MIPRILLTAVCLVHGALSRALPPTAQVPLLSSQHQDSAKPEHSSVLIAYKRNGEDHEATFQFPLRRPIRGSVLHDDPWHDTHRAVNSMKIVAVLDAETAAFRSEDELVRVRCRIEPAFSAEEVSAASDSGSELRVWPTFGVEDGIVILDRSDSRWFLAGRSIKNIECW
ncbi:hypothetical protein C7974DRAFT_148627 [Boeremia exigua]|uniref:uncharacterized protein n=1 Tax=Boeremia exigua TaxID=749465 RepID=UPI001E8E6A61|nr:uncharacterized protein C7974DRAFT_148627 [Boeremia exigua]KAH6637798.1 hypothetical protein C7974DRAFT_148627 [Boeremia exigua]